MMELANLNFRITITGNNTQEESDLVNKIAAEFVRLGMRKVISIADKKQIHFINGTAFDVTPNMQNLFDTNPLSRTDAYIVGHKPE